MRSSGSGLLIHLSRNIRQRRCSAARCWRSGAARRDRPARRPAGSPAAIRSHSLTARSTRPLKKSMYSRTARGFSSAAASRLDLLRDSRAAARASSALRRCACPSCSIAAAIVRIVLGHRYFSSPWSAWSSTSARSRTNGEISPSLTAVATVTGFVRNSHTVAIASTTTISAIAPNRLTPTRW